MSRKWRNILIGVLVAALVIGGIWLLSRSENNFRSKYEGADLSTDITGIGRSNTYNAYVAQYKDLPAVTDTVEVELASFEGEGGEVCADGVLTADESELTWKVNMPKAGLYNIQMEYLTVESRGIDIEREIAINGEVDLPRQRPSDSHRDRPKCTETVHHTRFDYQQGLPLGGHQEC